MNRTSAIMTHKKHVYMYVLYMQRLMKTNSLQKLDQCYNASTKICFTYAKFVENMLYICKFPQKYV